jgi:hypothetical protein
LAYLAYQVRQNTSSLRAENYARVLNRMATLQSNLSTDAELNRIVVTGAGNPYDLTRNERIRFSWALYELMGAAEFMYHQARDNALPAPVWERWQAGIVWWLSNPGILAWWQAKPSPLSSDFETFVEELMRARGYDEKAARRWTAFLSVDAGDDVAEPEPEPEHAPRSALSVG